MILVEGLHALNPKMLKSNEFSDRILKVYLCVDSVYAVNNKTELTEQDLRLLRRMYRDLFTRGRSLEETLQLWKTVCVGEEKYVAPFKYTADVIIDTIHPYEILLYANYLTTPLQELKTAKIKPLVNVLKNMKTVDKKNVPNNSLLWEFLVNKE